MKRPLFWAVAAFALGEVTGMFVSGIWQIGIALAMLICDVVYIIKKPDKWKYMVAMYVFMLFGILNVVLRTPPDVLEYENAEIDGYIYNKVVTANGINGYMRVDIIDGNELSYTLNAVVYKLPENIVIGDYIEVHGTLTWISEAVNPGQFDMKRYYRARGIEAAVTYMDKYEVCSRDSSNYKEIIFNIRKTISDKMYTTFDKFTADMYSGLLLGDRQGIDDMTRKLYQVGGISHILAISGLHISLIGMGVVKLLKALGMNVHMACVAAVLVIMFYGELVGWGFATIRAVIMLIMTYGGVWLGRKADVLTGGAVALFIMLIICPYRLIDSGLILSFSAVLGVAYGQSVMLKFERMDIAVRLKRRRKLLYFTFSSLVMAFCLQLIMAPVICLVYYVYPTYSMALNLIVLPLMSAVLISGIIGVIISFASPVFAELFIYPGKMILILYKYICEFIVGLPANSICTGKPPVSIIILYYGIIISLSLLSSVQLHRKIREKIYKRTHKWFSKKEWYRCVCVVYLVLTIMSATGLYFLHRAYLCEEIIFLDVGQGDGTIIRTENGINLVIDGGSVSKEQVGTYIIEPALKSQCMARVDYWFVSHTDKDHISGLIDILDDDYSGIDIRRIVFAKNMVRDVSMDEIVSRASERNIDIIYMDVADVITDGSKFLVRCVHPSDSFSTDDKNQASLILEYKSDSTSILFAGDADAEALEFMYENELDIHNQDSNIRAYDVIKVPHHGSKYSFYSRLYEGAELAVISCGYKNIYHHPHTEVLDGLSEAGVPVLRTDEMGAIVLRGKRN